MTSNLEHYQAITSDKSYKLTYLEKYFDDINTGKIIVGQELYTVLNKLISDKNDSKWIYDTKEANRRIRFIEKFCKHSKSPFHGKPFILELWEKAFIEVIYSFKKASTGLRRFKKSYSVN